MQTAEAVLSAINHLGRKGIPLSRIYRQLFNENLYITAYGKIYANAGATTPGTDGNSMDGMSLRRIHQIIEKMKWERYQPTSIRRVEIPKGNNQTRKLGIPTGDDKLEQEVVRMILEAKVEPNFSDLSHGFRPNRGCHTALHHVKLHWGGTRWFIEADIKGCFDNIDHDTLMEILSQEVKDKRFLELIKRFLKAGVLDALSGTVTRTYSGTPQGGILSPLLANIYLNKLDKYVEENLMPKYNFGKRRKANPAYDRFSYQIMQAREAGNPKEAKKWEILRRSVPSIDPMDPNFRRLKYIRYADDFVLGFIGSRKEAEEILESIKTFLLEKLKLETAASKTRVAHASTAGVEFLGYTVKVAKSTDKRRVNGDIWLGVPRHKIDKMMERFMKANNTADLPYIAENSDAEIVRAYQTRYRGFAQYYRFAYNRSQISRLKQVMEQSLVKTLARKHKTQVRKMYRKYESKARVNGRVYKVLKVAVENSEDGAVYWGGIPLTRDKFSPELVIQDRV